MPGRTFCDSRFDGSTRMAMKPTFTIRALLVLTAIVAACASLIRSSDWVAALGVAIMVALLFGAVQLRRRFRDQASARMLRGVLIGVAAVIGWFSIVDFSYWYEWCNHCREHRFVREYRVWAIPFYTYHEPNHVDILGRLRVDLGMTCDHQYERHHVLRMWGLIYPARPCTSLTCCFCEDPEYYNERVSRRVRQFAAEDPLAARRLCERIVNNEDYDAMRAFIAAMKRPGGSWGGEIHVTSEEQEIEPGQSTTPVRE